MTQTRASTPSPPLPTGNRPRIRHLGYSPGKFAPGPKISILDVPGYCPSRHRHPHRVDRHPLPRGVKDTRLRPCYAATHDLNGMGELTGSHALAEHGYMNTPIAITNTVSVGKAYDGLFPWEIEQARNNGEDDIESLRRFSIPLEEECSLAAFSSPVLLALVVCPLPVGGHSAGRNFSGEIFLALSTGTSPDQLATSSDGFAHLPPLKTQPVETTQERNYRHSLLRCFRNYGRSHPERHVQGRETLVGFKGRTTAPLAGRQGARAAEQV
ncbi:hypothetical protein CCMA1212_002425 [Trichoderma ghanense]|uniref:Uncharacterized protein n=1 Tax=Trichoderma ghanense TaxID=65468 RepID=A0ABY2HD11_9HYPO